MAPMQRGKIDTLRLRPQHITSSGDMATVARRPDRRGARETVGNYT